MNSIQRQGIGMTSLRTRERLVERLISQGIQRIDVLEAIRNTPRHLFVDEALAQRAYEDTALPIGHGQTISQPYIVARMTEAVMAGRPRLGKVLEIGTGCGYQTMILAGLADQVFSIERIDALLRRTRQRLLDLGVRNVTAKLGDGSLGWPVHGPFDGIITTAGANRVPGHLLAQLAPGGVLVIPVGPSGHQQLKVFTRQDDGKIHEQGLDAVLFVPLLSGVVRE